MIKIPRSIVRSFRSPLLLATTLALSPCSLFASEAQEPQILASMQGMGDLAYHRLESKLLERPFHIQVRKPNGYEQNPDRHYPTIFLLDGGTTFPMLNAYSSYLAMAGDLLDVLVVGISYGTDDWTSGNLRSTDFTAEAADREHYGGAPKFQQVLRSELIPLIEGNYRANPKRRMIFGQSLGGQFVLYTALTSPDLFWGHIASNPALHRNLPFFQQPHWGSSQSPSEPSRVFVSTAEFDDPRFKKPALEWIQNWSQKNNLPFELETTELKGHNHFSAAPDAFREGMMWLLRSGAIR